MTAITLNMSTGEFEDDGFEAETGMTFADARALAEELRSDELHGVSGNIYEPALLLAAVSDERSGPFPLARELVARGANSGLVAAACYHGVDLAALTAGAEVALALEARTIANAWPDITDRVLARFGEYGPNFAHQATGDDADDETNGDDDEGTLFDE